MSCQSENYGEVLDVAIIGAGISGINTAYRVREADADSKYTVFEGRKELGGTWSLFKYPGIRSDSDLFSFGFEWNPWQAADKVIAKADVILDYMNSTVKKFGIDKHIVYEHRLVSMNWSSKEQLWTLQFKLDEEQEKEKIVKARWVVLGTGYYSYEQALPTVIPGLENFQGKIVHPQFWPEDLDLTDKRVAIIGSGATAVTILPAIIEKVRQVTLVQRSPSYVASTPSHDGQADFLKRWLPLGIATRILRLKYILVGFLFFRFCRAFPQRARNMLTADAKSSLPENISTDPHFTPRYGPWQQRLCFFPDKTFFDAFQTGKANVITGHIETITKDSIKIIDQPDNTCETDIIVTATGLKIRVGGGSKVTIDGQSVKLADKMFWKACMMQDVPNVITVIGYTNASWTLGADVAAKTLTRMMKHQKQTGSTSAAPVVTKERDIQPRQFFELESTYLLKGAGEMPKAGNKYPWLPRASYFSDYWDAAHGDITQDMAFGRLI